MIYNNYKDISGDIKDLSDKLLEKGFDAKDVKACMEYLSGESGEEFCPLAKHRTDVRNHRLIFFFDVVAHIVTKGDDKLTERLVEVLFALTGIQVLYLMNNVYYKEDILSDVLKRRYGSKGECYMLACRVYNWFVYETRDYRNRIFTRPYTAEELFISAEIALEYDECETALILCAMGLERCVIRDFALNKEFAEISGERMAGENSGIADKLVNLTKKAGKSVKDSNPYYLMALAEASYFDLKIRGKFMSLIPDKATEVGKKTMKYIPDGLRFFSLMSECGKAMTLSFCKFFYYNCHSEKLLQKTVSDYVYDFKRLVSTEQNANTACHVNRIIEQVRPEQALEKEKIRDIFRAKISKEICYRLPGYSNSVRDYLYGKKTIDEIITEIGENYRDKSMAFDKEKSTYYFTVFGEDDFIDRCIVFMCMNPVFQYSFTGTLVGFEPYSGKPEKMLKLLNILFDGGLDERTVLEAFSPYEMWFGNDDRINKISEVLKLQPDIIEKFSEENVSESYVCVRGAFLKAMSAQPNRFKKRIFSMASDNSKIIRGIVRDIVSEHTDWRDDICGLLTGKAVQKRLAMEIIAVQGVENYRAELENALKKEKSEKMRDEIETLLGVSADGGESDTSTQDTENIVKKFVGKNRAKKVEWLFTSPFGDLKLKDGSVAGEDFLKALLVSYTDITNGVFDTLAEKLFELTDKDSLADFANEVFARWLGANSPAKTKWAVYFTAVNGNNSTVTEIVKAIKKWSENKRGAIAAEAVQALAMNGSSEALIQVDAMARKFKNSQVQTTAQRVMENTAKRLNITTQQLADRVVPNLGFDENMCRKFDYGNREFSVYLLPTLDIEIFNGEKRVKNLPKPCASDDKEIAEKSYSDFKEMKKQLKNIVAIQRDRLEYVLMCNRKWTAEEWKNLFVKNPVMHCFAIGLIWAVYDEKNNILQTFRYMDDGSFTTSDEEEFELPENAEIGLVHPIEIPGEEKEIWLQQLEDYEINQPFPQLSRPVYRATEQEKNSTEITRFSGVSTQDMTLKSRMLKYNWTTGDVLDGGAFYDFWHEDISEIFNSIPQGFCAKLSFSGMSINVGYWGGGESVSIEKLEFYLAGHTSKPIKISDVDERYFSEIINQLYFILGVSPDDTDD